MKAEGRAGSHLTGKAGRNRNRTSSPSRTGHVLFPAAQSGFLQSPWQIPPEHQDISSKAADKFLRSLRQFLPNPRDISSKAPGYFLQSPGIFSVAGLATCVAGLATCVARPATTFQQATNKKVTFEQKHNSGSCIKTISI